MLINKKSLKQDLTNMGLKSTDTVLLHTSMKKIGIVDGGANSVIEALMEYFSKGLVCFPALSWTTAQMEQPVFDVKNTKSIVGLLPEIFRNCSGVIRSWNPTHSMSAYGKDAEEFTQENPVSGTPCGLNSPWHKLIRRDAKILMVGCDLTSCTFMHGVEEWCKVPNRLGNPIPYTIILPDGNKIKTDSAAHRTSPSKNYWKVEEGLHEAGLAKYFPFGDAETIILNARELFAYLAGCLSLNIKLFDD
ncbi:MAG: AAC(3) family N-acetyltransferase [Clostridiales bacterium]|nr:AAC(3) family N-acetyltransferase [Clostridiales bacterium]